MKVRDYVYDMVTGQKWCVVLDQLTWPSECEHDYFEISHYSIPHSRCKYLNYDVRYFKIIDNELYLYLKKSEDGK